MDLSCALRRFRLSRKRRTNIRHALLRRTNSAAGVSRISEASAASERIRYLRRERAQGRHRCLPICAAQGTGLSAPPPKTVDRFLALLLDADKLKVCIHLLTTCEI